VFVYFRQCVYEKKRYFYVFWCWTARVYGEGNMCVGYGISVVMFCVCV
jgi:hypothetical protein